MMPVLSLFCVLIVAVSVLGGIFPLARLLDHTRLQVYLSFAAGSMLGAAFFHMLPEAVEGGSPSTIRWTGVGLLGLFFLERFFSFHHHEPQVPSPEGGHDHGHASHGRHPSRNTPDALSWWTAAFGLAVHSLVGGVALASAVAADHAARGAIGATGWGVFLATLLHKPADSLTIVTLMLRSGAPRRLAHAVNLGFAAMIPLGVLLFVLGLGGLSADAASRGRSIALAFSAGTFLCIALSDLLPELQFHSHDRWKLSVALIAGFALMAGTASIELF
ncbi:zinc transporter ZupT [Aquisphaera giovannonii]|uniref:Zinc transporter ZupT n=1 Tax=Aquisphaera giovannonii TaxID=406548 RepID=A0A5B9W8Q0_9BACT|nr:ZIP family metal transporter [Aquisphaera giovannonii]QEH36455.1 zinc transporter ZupT [Aquisphaera giovannonii]